MENVSRYDDYSMNEVAANSSFCTKKGKNYFYFEGRWEHEKIYVLCVCKFVIIPNYSELFDSDFCLVNTIVRLHLNHDARKFFNTFV